MTREPMNNKSCFIWLDKIITLEAQYTLSKFQIEEYLKSLIIELSPELAPFRETIVLGIENYLDSEVAL